MKQGYQIFLISLLQRVLHASLLPHLLHGCSHTACFCSCLTNVNHALVLVKPLTSWFTLWLIEQNSALIIIGFLFVIFRLIWEHYLFQTFPHPWPLGSCWCFLRCRLFIWYLAYHFDKATMILQIADHRPSFGKATSYWFPH